MRRRRRLDGAAAQCVNTYEDRPRRSHFTGGLSTQRRAAAEPLVAAAKNARDKKVASLAIKQNGRRRQCVTPRHSCSRLPEER
jgi:hypothetical protein